MEQDPASVKQEPEEDYEGYERMDTEAAAELGLRPLGDDDGQPPWNSNDTGDLIGDIKQEVHDSEELGQDLVGDMSTSLSSNLYLWSGPIIESVSDHHVGPAESLVCQACGKAVSAKRGLAKHKCRKKASADSRKGEGPLKIKISLNKRRTKSGEAAKARRSLNGHPSLRCIFCSEEFETPKLYALHHCYNCSKRGILVTETVECSACRREYDGRDSFVSHFRLSCVLAGSPDYGLEASSTPDLLAPDVTIHEQSEAQVKIEPGLFAGDLDGQENRREHLSSVRGKEEFVDENEDMGSSMDEDGNPKRAKTGPKKDLRCPLCPKTFLHEESLDIHLRNYCTEMTVEARQSGICPRCSKQLCNEKSLLRHMQYSCPNVAFKKEGTPVSCPQCGKTFTSQFCKDVLRKHIRLCGKEVPFSIVECVQCNRKFQGVYCKDLLRRHIMRCHTDPESRVQRFMTVKCDMCGQEYSGNYCRDVLRKHMQFSCPGREESSKQKALASSQCDMCGKVFSGTYANYRLRKHARSCTGKPVEVVTEKTESSAICFTCGKTFTGLRCRDTLRVHERKCGDKGTEEPLTARCQICLKLFSGRDPEGMLSRHLQLCFNMRGTRLYKVLDHETAECKACKKVFRGKTSYRAIKRHLKVCQPPSVGGSGVSDSEGSLDDMTLGSCDLDSTVETDSSFAGKNNGVDMQIDHEVLSVNADVCADVDSIEKLDQDESVGSDEVVNEKNEETNSISVPCSMVETSVNISKGAKILGNEVTSNESVEREASLGDDDEEDSSSSGRACTTEMEAKGKPTADVRSSFLNIACEKCGITFTPLHYELHKLTSLCWNEANYSCPKCDIKCLSEQGLRWHLRSNKCK